MNEIDWKNAPEGATHYAAAEGVWYACFYKDDFKQVWVCDDESEQWYPQWPSLAKGRSVIPRPTPTVIPELKKLTQAVKHGLPSEYRWAAVDSDGEGNAYALDPSCVEEKKYGMWDYPANNDVCHISLGSGYDTTDWQNSLIEREELTTANVFQKLAEKMAGGWAECQEKREESIQTLEAELSALRTQAVADAAEIERLKDKECDLITSLEKDKKLLLDQMAFLLTATMGGHLSKDDHDALVMDSIKIVEGMTYMPFASYVHVIRAGG